MKIAESLQSYYTSKRENILYLSFFAWLITAILISSIFFSQTAFLSYYGSQLLFLMFGETILSSMIDSDVGTEGEFKLDKKKIVIKPLSQIDIRDSFSINRLTATYASMPSDHITNDWLFGLYWKDLFKSTSTYIVVAAQFIGAFSVSLFLDLSGKQLVTMGLLNVAMVIFITFLLMAYLNNRKLVKIKKNAKPSLLAMDFAPFAIDVTNLNYEQRFKAIVSKLMSKETSDQNAFVFTGNFQDLLELLGKLDSLIRHPSKDYLRLISKDDFDFFIWLNLEYVPKIISSLEGLYGTLKENGITDFHVPNEFYQNIAINILPQLNDHRNKLLQIVHDVQAGLSNQQVNLSNEIFKAYSVQSKNDALEFMENPKLRSLFKNMIQEALPELDNLMVNATDEQKETIIALKKEFQDYFDQKKLIETAQTPLSIEHSPNIEIESKLVENVIDNKIAYYRYYLQGYKNSH